MTAEEMLTALKIDLGITTTAYDVRLAQYIATAKKEMEREGVRDDGTVDYGTIVTLYAAWMWRRRDTGEGMPRMIRYALNNFIFDQHINGNKGGDSNG